MLCFVLLKHAPSVLSYAVCKALLVLFSKLLKGKTYPCSYHISALKKPSSCGLIICRKLKKKIQDSSARSLARSLVISLWCLVQATQRAFWGWKCDVGGNLHASPYPLNSLFECPLSPKHQTLTAVLCICSPSIIYYSCIYSKAWRWKFWKN